MAEAFESLGGFGSISAERIQEIQTRISIKEKEK